MNYRRLLGLRDSAVAAGCLFVASLFLIHHRKPESLPRGLTELGEWVSRHPADWFAFMTISDLALGSDVPQPQVLWKESAAAATALSPYRTDPRIAFVRGGLMQWMSLSQQDRKLVLDSAAPLLSDPEIFGRVSVPLLHLTGDLGYLRKHGPRGLNDLIYMQSLAATSGDFAAYREIRKEISALRMALVDSSDPQNPGAALAKIPVPIRDYDDLLAKKVLARLAETRYVGEAATSAQADALADYALRHGLQQLDGLEPLVTSLEGAGELARARLALFFGRPEIAESIRLSSSNTDDTAWAQYYLDRAKYEARRGRKQEADSNRARVLGLKDALAAWKDTCGPQEVCRRSHQRIVAAGASTPYEIELEPVSVNAQPYFMLFVDDRLIAEDLLRQRQKFVEEMRGEGIHTVEIEVVNPFNRSGEQCRLRIARTNP